MKRFILILTILYLLLLVAGAIVMHSSWNSHWLVTLFLFSPRWVTGLPLLGLVPLTIGLHWRWSWVCLLQIIVILVPIMGYQFGGNTEPPLHRGPLLRVLSCNVGGGELDQTKLVNLIRDHHIDVVMLQECMPAISDPLFHELGWSHQQSHNIAIGSPLSLGDPVALAMQPGTYRAAAAMSCQLQWPQGEGEPVIRVLMVSLHLPTFRPAFEKLQRLDANNGAKALAEVAQKYRLVAEEIRDGVKDSIAPVILGGDFNMPSESVHYQDYWHDYHNAHSRSGTGFGYTKFTRYHGVRIDHVVAGKCWTILDSWVGPDLGGDHRPVIATLTHSISTCPP